MSELQLPKKLPNRKVLIVIGAAAAGFVAWSYYSAGSGAGDAPAAGLSGVDAAGTPSTSAGAVFASSGAQTFAPEGAVLAADPSAFRTPQSRAEYTQSAEQYAIDVWGSKPMAVTDALGAWFAGRKLTAAQIRTVDKVRAAWGDPIGGAPAIKIQPTIVGPAVKPTADRRIPERNAPRVVGPAVKKTSPSKPAGPRVVGPAVKNGVKK